MTTPNQPVAAEPEDTCRLVEIDGEPVRVHGQHPMSPESTAALGEVIAAARRRYAAEHPEPADEPPAARLTPAPAPAASLRDRIAAALVTAGVACYACTCAFGRQDGCADCDHDRDRIADALLPLVSAAQAPVLSEAERTMLIYALDQAQERIWSEDGFTDEDQAAVTSLRRLAEPARADAEEQQPPPPAQTPACEGFVWIGQPFTTCERCGRPAWEHDGEEIPVEGAGPFDMRLTVRPWRPGQADRLRARADAEDGARHRDALRDLIARVGRGRAGADIATHIASHLDAEQALADAKRAAHDAHRTALSTALGLGTSAPWDAITDRARQVAADLDAARAGDAPWITAYREDLEDAKKRAEQAAEAHEEHRRQLADALGGMDPATPWDSLIRRAAQVLAGRRRAFDTAQEIEADRDRLAADLAQASATAAAYANADSADAAAGSYAHRAEQAEAERDRLAAELRDARHETEGETKRANRAEQETCATRTRAELAEGGREAADVVIRATLAALGAGPDTDPVIRAREVAARAEQAEAQVRDYENRITWETTCGEHARLLDACRAGDEAREKAEAGRDRWKAAAFEQQQRASKAEATIARVRDLADRLADGTEAGFRAALDIRAALDGEQPAAEPGPALSEVCCVCGCPDITYRNCNEQPFCCRCAMCCEPPKPCAHGCQPPTAEPEPKPREACWSCGSPKVAYHSYRGQAFCWPCAGCGCGQVPCERTGINDPAVSAEAEEPCFHPAWETTGGARRCTDCGEWLDPQPAPVELDGAALWAAIRDHAFNDTRWWRKVKQRQDHAQLNTYVQRGPGHTPTR